VYFEVIPITQNPTTMKFNTADKTRIAELKEKLGITNATDIIRIAIKEKHDKEITKHV